MSLLSELKRRHVFRVGIAYLVMAWVALQVVVTIEEPLNLPGWFDTSAIILLALGFPVVLIFAWAFELSPGGIKLDHGTGLPKYRVSFSILILITAGFSGLLILIYLRSFAAMNEGGLAEQGGDTASGISRAVNAGPGLTHPQRYQIHTGAVEAIPHTAQLHAHVSISKDGSFLVYALSEDGRSRLYRRWLDQLHAQPIPGTSYAEYPELSPDGEWVIFDDDVVRGLRKLHIATGISQVLVRDQSIHGASWGDDGNIVYSGSENGSGSHVFRVSANGGVPEQIITAAPSAGYFDTEVLPDSRAVLVVRDNWEKNPAAPVIEVYSFDSGELKSLVTGYRPRYAASGHLLFVREDTLWAAPFDIETLELTGPERPVVQNLETNSDQASASYALSDNGVLVYVRGSDLARPNGQRGLVWVDRDGKTTQLLAPMAGLLQARLSPDGGKIAYTLDQAGDRDIWILDIADNSSTRLTFDVAHDQHPLWTVDSARIVFASGRDGGGIFWKSADSLGRPERLVEGSHGQAPLAFSSDGQILLYRDENLRSEIRAYNMNGRTTEDIFMTDNDEDYSAISPDGRWIAYELDAIYISPYPNIEDGRWQISQFDDHEPVWHPDGREIYFREGESGAIMAVTVSTESGAFSAGPVRRVVAAPASGDGPSYSISPDATRFLVITDSSPVTGTSKEASLVIVNNWFAELQSLIPSKYAEQGRGQ